MLLYEYDEEEFIASEKELSYAEGKAEGEAKGEAKGEIKARTEAVLELLEDLGEIPDTLRNKILEQENLDILKRWIKLSAKAVSVEEFENQINET